MHHWLLSWAVINFGLLALGLSQAAAGRTIQSVGTEDLSWYFLRVTSMADHHGKWYISGPVKLLAVRHGLH
jgi:hypothetical protein